MTLLELIQSSVKCPSSLADAWTLTLRSFCYYYCLTCGVWRKGLRSRWKTNLRTPWCLHFSFRLMELQIQRQTKKTLGVVAVYDSQRTISTLKLSCHSLLRTSLNCMRTDDVCTCFQDFLHVFAHRHFTTLISHQLFGLKVFEGRGGFRIIQISRKMCHKLFLQNRFNTLNISESVPVSVTQTGQTSQYWYQERGHRLPEPEPN